MARPTQNPTSRPRPTRSARARAGRAALLAALLGAPLAAAPAPAWAQAAASTLSEAEQEELARRKRLEEMENLLRVAKEAGFSEEEVKKITIESETEGTIVVWEWVEAERERLKRREADAEELAKKRYLTVEDVTVELNQREGGALNNLRDNLILSGDQEE